LNNYLKNKEKIKTARFPVPFTAGLFASSLSDAKFKILTKDEEI
jgi:hypothetical protein